MKKPEDEIGLTITPSSDLAFIIDVYGIRALEFYLGKYAESIPPKIHSQIETFLWEVKKKGKVFSRAMVHQERIYWEEKFPSPRKKT